MIRERVVSAYYRRRPHYPWAALRSLMIAALSPIIGALKPIINLVAMEKVVHRPPY